LSPASLSALVIVRKLCPLAWADAHPETMAIAQRYVDGELSLSELMDAIAQLRTIDP